MIVNQQRMSTARVSLKSDEKITGTLIPVTHCHTMFICDFLEAVRGDGFPKLGGEDVDRLRRRVFPSSARWFLNKNCSVTNMLSESRFLLKIKTKKEKFQDQINHWSMMKTNDFCHLGGVRETIKTNPTVMLMREKVINLSIRQLWPKGIEGSKLKGARINILQFHNKSLNLSNLKRDESQKYTAIVII